MAIIVLVLIALVLPAPPAWSSVPTLLTLAVQIVCCVPRLRSRYGWWLLAVQAVLFAWGGQPSFLAASVLLVVAGRLRWALFAAVVVAATVMKLGPDLYPPVNAFGNTVSQGLLIFVLSRLRELRDALRAGRERFAAESVAQEREQAGRNLESTLGSALSTIIGLAERARPREILTVARTAAAEARRPPAPLHTPDPDDLTPRLAVPVQVTVFLWYPVVASLVVWRAEVPVLARVGDLAVIVVVVALQAYHTLPRPLDVRPRYAGWTLPAQILLCALPLFVPDRAYPQLLGWAAASILVIMPPRAAWPVVVAFMAGSTAVVAVRTGSVVAVLSQLIDTSSTAVLFYGLALLTHLVYDVRQARLALATLAVGRERRRISSDIHDLLGSGLSAIIVKAELAAGAPRRAAAELADIARIARRALTELRAIPGDGDPALSLRVELASGREVLTAAGVTTSIELDPPPLPRAVDALLATVLREAITNVLRHSRARHCAVAVTSSAGQTHLSVTNDGVPDSAPDRVSDRAPDGVSDGAAADAPDSPGQGHANLTSRVAAWHGHLSAGRTRDGGYLLAVRVPLSRPSAPA